MLNVCLHSGSFFDKRKKIRQINGGQAISLNKIHNSLQFDEIFQLLISVQNFDWSFSLFTKCLIFCLQRQQKKLFFCSFIIEKGGFDKTKEVFTQN